MEILLQLFITMPLALGTFLVFMFAYVLYQNVISYFRILYIRKNKDKILLEVRYFQAYSHGGTYETIYCTVPAYFKNEYYRWVLSEDGIPTDYLVLCNMHKRFLCGSEDGSPRWFKLDPIDTWFRSGESHAGTKWVRKMLQDVSGEHFVLHKLSSNL